MIIVLSVMVGGFVLGLLFKKWRVANEKSLQWLDQVIMLAIWFLLFTLGVSIGANEFLVSSLGSLGFQAVVISALATFCSVLLAWVVFVFVFKHEG
ncbi:MAG: LysO family transporter [Patescibacteria group bacterium]